LFAGRGAATLGYARRFAASADRHGEIAGPTPSSVSLALGYMAARKVDTLATWLITGCSTGLGRALATTLLDRGETVVATARSMATIDDLGESHPDTALTLPLDVTDEAQRRAVVHRAHERFGGIDVVVNNAGHGYRAAVEEADAEQVQELFATNFFGPVALIQAVLPAMRARRGGTIVNISSGGVRSCPIGAGHYVATKAALGALATSLAKEIQPLGITVITVEPGAFRTNYKRSLTQVDQPLDAYADTVGVRRRDDFTGHDLQPGDPVKGAEAIITAVQSSQPPRLLVLGPDSLAWFRDSVRELTADVDAWEHAGIATNFAD
jgi:NAD(P)-dependent dehydrogenase (short-subunit alcohol dehydrogenase family)